MEGKVGKGEKELNEENEEEKIDENMNGRKEQKKVETILKGKGLEKRRRIKQNKQKKIKKNTMTIQT